MDVHIRQLPSAEWPSLGDFILRHNRRADGLQCLHAAQGETLESLTLELRALPPDEAGFWAAEAGGRRVAIIGCEIDPALQRAWLRGPLVAQPASLQALAPRLIRHLEQALPAVRCFDAFPSVDAAELDACYEQAGYAPLAVYRVLRAPLLRRTQPFGVRRATRTDLPAALALHFELFPKAYVREADFDAALHRPDRLLLVAHDPQGDLAGYLYATDDPDQDQVYIDYLGVRADRRRQGHGRGLLQAAMAWGLAAGHRHAALTVREDDPKALALYEGAGFSQVSAGRHRRKEAGPPAS